MRRRSPIDALYILNKSGSLIYYREFLAKPSGKTDNEHITLASTFFGINAMANTAAPVESRGITSLRTSTVVVQCLTSLTGMTFFAIAPAGGKAHHLETLLRAFYTLYADYVLKNPFYELVNGEPGAVRSQGRGALFDAQIDKLLNRG